MVRLLEEEVTEALRGHPGDDRVRRVTVATGVLAAPFLRAHGAKIQEHYPNVQIQVLEVKNEFFGEQITVAGLLTGQDLIAQLKGKDLGDRLLITSSMLKCNEPVFLDDTTVAEVENALQIKIFIVESSGTNLIECMIE